MSADTILADYKRQIMQLAQSKPPGITNEDIKAAIPEYNQNIMLEAANQLVHEQQLEVFLKGAGKSLVYKYKDPAKRTSASSGMDSEELVVHEIIAESGNMGIWLRDIRIKSQLGAQISKVLKNLETRKIIKAIKSVNASKKKVYMLYNVEPNPEVTGGAWYQDSDFEAEFVDVLNQQCLRYLQMRREAAKKLNEGPIATHMKTLCTVKEVQRFISELGISKIPLDEHDLETILKTVIYDGKAQRILQADGSYFYKSVEPLLPPEGLVQSPCGICPVISNCSDVGSITPKTCAYMSDWLE